LRLGYRPNSTKGKNFYRLLFTPPLSSRHPILHGGGKNPRVAKSYSRSGRPYSSPSSAVCRRRSKSLPPEWPPLLLTRPPRRRGRGHRAVGGGAAGRIRPQYAMEEEAAPSSCSSPDVPWRRSRPPRTRLQRWGAGERRGDGGGGGADRVGVR
jgi:hypothetical protein